MSAADPTVKERLATLEEEIKDLGRYVRNDVSHRIGSLETRIGRLEMAIYLLAVGVAGTFLAAVLATLLS